MLFKTVRLNKTMFVSFMAIGIVTGAFGALGMFVIEVEHSHAYDMLMGMFTGFGATLAVIGIVGFLVLLFMPSDKLKQKEIEEKDERNIAITNAAGTVGYFAAAGCCLVMAFLFIGLGYILPSFVAIGSMYVSVIAVLIAKACYKKKM